MSSTLKFVKVINFIEIASKSLLDTIDYCFDCNYYNELGFDNIIIDLTKDKTLEFLKDSVMSNLKRLEEFGKRHLIINTCSPYSNWRQKNRGKPIRSTKYNIVDSSVHINSKHLDNLLNKIWNLLKTNSTYILLSHPALDISDINLIVADKIGSEFLIQEPTSFLILADGNFNYQRQNIKEIPDYLVQEIEKQLKHNRLI